MAEAMRTPEDRFAVWKDYPFAPHYLERGGLRVHYVDEGAPGRPVALLLHGMPTSSYLYRRMIPPLVTAGYRCVAPDWIGFGKSDKVLDDDWYAIERHVETCAQLIAALDLRRITLVVQDWGGPIGLRQAVDAPERFARLVVMNTWLHSPAHEYSDAIRRWNAGWQPGAPLDAMQPCGRVMRHFLENYPRGSSPLSPEEAEAAYEAPFPDRASKAGPRRFPLSLPFYAPERGNAADQERCFEALRAWAKPVHFVWGARDDVFTEAWGRRWAGTFRGATFDALDAGHFLQESHGPEVVEILLRRIAEEPAGA